MKSTVLPSALLALILTGISVTTGCSSFDSGSSDYVAPGGLSQDVSDLPDPNAPAPLKNETTKILGSSNQYGYNKRPPETPERLLAQADSYFEQKRYHDAERLYKKYLATQEATVAPSELLAVVHYRLGFVERKKMFFANAANEFKQASGFAPQNDEYLFLYAKSSYEANDYPTADKQFVQLLNRAPNYPEAQYYYGLTLLESSNRTNALTPLTVAVGELQAYALLTDRFYAKGEIDQAVQTEGQLIQIAARLGREVPKLPHKTSQGLGPALNANSQPLPAPQYAAYANQVAAPETEPAQPQFMPAQGYLALPETPVKPNNEFVPTTEGNESQPQNPIPTTESAVQPFASYAPSAGGDLDHAEPTFPTTEGTAFPSAGDRQEVPPMTENAAPATDFPTGLNAVPTTEGSTSNQEELPVIDFNQIGADVSASTLNRVSAPNLAATGNSPNIGQANPTAVQSRPSEGFALSASASILQSLNENQNAQAATFATATPPTTEGTAAFSAQSMGLNYVPVQAQEQQNYALQTSPIQTYGNQYNAGTAVPQPQFGYAQTTALQVPFSAVPNSATAAQAPAAAPAEEEFAFATSGSTSSPATRADVPYVAAVPNGAVAYASPIQYAQSQPTVASAPAQPYINQSQPVHAELPDNSLFRME